MTKTELARLVKVARSLGHYRMSGTEKEFTCPLDFEANRKEGRRGIGVHRFTVSHFPWNSGTSVAEVTAALADHIDPGAEACSRVTDS